MSVSCTGLVRSYGPTPVLRGLDLRVAAGERIAVLGPNGSGKSTLLGVLAGILRPHGGGVTVLAGAPDDPRVRRRVGYAGHQPFMYPRLSADENLRFRARLHREPAAVDTGRDLLRTLELDPTDRRPVEAYSQGMRRRAALACTLACDPDVLLLDEPFTGLDAAGAGAVTDLLAASRAAMILVTHEPARAARITGRSLELRDGRLVEAAG